MRKTIFVVCVLLASLACAPAASAQDNQSQSAGKTTEPPHFYHLKLVVQELDAAGKVTNSRSYFTTISTGKELGYNANNSIRTESRMPMASGTFSTGGPSVMDTQFQYINVGTNFDIHDVHELGQQLSLHVKADISSFGGNAPVGGGNIHEPIIRHNQWESSLLIPIDKPTVIFTSDSLDSKGAMQVVATATPIPE